MHCILNSFETFYSMDARHKTSMIWLVLGVTLFFNRVQTASINVSDSGAAALRHHDSDDLDDCLNSQGRECRRTDVNCRDRRGYPCTDDDHDDLFQAASTNVSDSGAAALRYHDSDDLDDCLNSQGKECRRTDVNCRDRRGYPCTDDDHDDLLHDSDDLDDCFNSLGQECRHTDVNCKDRSGYPCTDDDHDDCFNRNTGKRCYDQTPDCLDRKGRTCRDLESDDCFNTKTGLRCYDQGPQCLDRKGRKCTDDNSEDRSLP